MASGKSATTRVKRAMARQKVAGVSIDLDQLEHLYPRTQTAHGRKNNRDDRKRDDGDGIRRDDTF